MFAIECMTCQEILELFTKFCVVNVTASHSRTFKIAYQCDRKKVYLNRKKTEFVNNLLSSA